MALKKLQIAFEMPVVGYTDETLEMVGKSMLHGFRKLMDEWCATHGLSHGDMTAKVNDAESPAYYNVTF